MATIVMTKDWTEIFYSAAFIMSFIVGFLVIGLSVRYCLTSFNCKKHVFLLLLTDLLTSLVFLAVAIVPMVMKIVMTSRKMACILEVKS